MITYSTDSGSFGEVFFYRKNHVFWLPPMRYQEGVNYELFINTETVPNDRFRALSSTQLTQWDEDAS